MILIGEFINQSFSLTSMLRFYFSQCIGLEGGFIDLFPKKQGLFVCPDVILLPLTWEWLGSCPWEFTVSLER